VALNGGVSVQSPDRVAEQHLGVPVKSPCSISAPPALVVTVVDDEPMAQDVLVRAARSWHFDCQSAASAEQALELLEQNLTPIVSRICACRAWVGSGWTGQ
jgi:hypothetical protein